MKKKTIDKKKNKNEKLIFRIIKEVVKIFSIAIAIIIIVEIAIDIYCKYFDKFASPMTCSTYGTNYKDIKVGKRYYCCAKTEDGDYKGCILMSDD